jgi:hypothetical protein
LEQPNKTQIPDSALNTSISEDQSTPISSGDIGKLASGNGMPLKPENVLELQRSLGNQHTINIINRSQHRQQHVNDQPKPFAGLRMGSPIQRTAKIIQRAPDGLIDLGGGYRGEVGIEARLKKGAVVKQIGDKDDYTMPEAANIFVHDILDKNKYFVQIPGHVLKLVEKGTDEAKKKAKKGLDNDDVNKRKDPVKGTVRKKDVSEVKGQLTHKDVTEPLFPEGGPKPEHIEQRSLGNCYFLAALGSVAKQHPSYLRDMMSDGGDTVSVRFYKPEKAPKTGFKTEYVTVRKSVVKGKAIGRGKGLYSATHVPWPALATKAYAAWDGHDKAGLPGFGGTYKATAGGHSSSVYGHIMGETGVKEDLSKTVGKLGDIENVPQGMSREWILPGHPARPVVEVWFPYMFNKVRQMVSPGNYKDYLPGDDNTDEQRIKAFIKDKITDPAGYDIEKVSIEGSIFEVEQDVQLSQATDISEDEAKKWIAYVNGDGKAARDKATKVGDKDGVMDRGTFDTLLKKSGLSKSSQSKLREFSKEALYGTPDDVYYNSKQIAMYNKMKDHIAAGGMISGGTPKYGGGGGISGDEDVETVAGIPGGHAYTILGVSMDEESGRRFVRIRNPWGSTGRAYNEDFTEAKEVSSAESDVELSDFSRFFNNLYWAAQTEQTKQSFSVADIKHKK